MKYRKKSVVVEAERWFPGRNIDGVVTPDRNSISRFSPFVNTLNGPVTISPGDWIITGVHGEKYPCDPDIFQETYEKVRP